LGVVLQGAYGDDTNTDSESDVGVFLGLNEFFLSDRTKLTE
jgi:hypothetical protein